MAVSARIQEIYLALFGRPADPVGGEYYDTLTNDGANLDPILTGASRLSSSTEYTDRFTGLTDSQIIESIYNSLFGHNADLGMAFHDLAVKIEAGCLVLEERAEPGPPAVSEWQRVLDRHTRP